MRQRLFWLTLFLFTIAGASGPAQPPLRGAPPFAGKTLDEWANTLDNVDPRVRCRAATALGLGPFGKAAVPSLLRALGDTNKDVRLSAIAALRYLGPDAAPAIPFLERLMAKDPGRMTYACLGCLAQMGPVALPTLSSHLQQSKERLFHAMSASSLCAMGEAAVPVLTAVLQHRDAEIRQCVIYELSNHPALASSLLPGLKGILHADDVSLRMAALYTLGRVASCNTVPVSEMAKLLDDEKCGDTAAEALGQLGKRALPYLRQAFVDKDPDVRVRAVAALAKVGPETLPLLTKALKDPDAAVRLCALKGVVSLRGPKKMAPLLIESLKDQDESIRFTALVTLTDTSPIERRTILLLVAALDDASDFIRSSARSLLVHLGPKAAAAIPALVVDLQRKEERRYQAAEMLGEIGLPDQAAVRALCVALRNRDAAVRIAAATALGRIGPSCRQVQDVTEGPAGMAAEIVVSALRRALRDRDAEPRVAAALALWRVGDRLPVIPRILTDVAADTNGRAGTAARGRAMKALAVLGPAAAPAVPVLISALRDEDLRFCAVAGLKAVGPAAKAAVPALAKVLREKLSFMEIFEVADSLRQIGPPSVVVPFLSKAVSDGNEKVLMSLSVQGDRLGPAGWDLLPALLKALHHSKSDVRQLAVHVIQRLKGVGASPALAEATSDRDEGVRRAACNALGELGPASRPAIPALAAALLDDAADVRLAAAQALQRIGPAIRPILPTLIDLLSARDKGLAVAVAQTIGGLGAAGRPALTALDALLSDKDGKLRVAAAVATWKITHRKNRSLPVLLKGLKDADSSVRLAAALALRKVEPSKPVVSVLVSLLTEEAVRQQAAETLEAMRPLPRDAAPALGALLEDRDSEVRRLAWRLLEKLAPQAALRLEGRMLAHLIHKGMTTEQVERLLGKDQCPVPTGGVVGGVQMRTLRYFDLGLWVGLLSDAAGILRVNGVTMAPLLDCP